jgi:hypothetical protein
VVARLSETAEHLRAAGSEEEAASFEAHVEFAEDPELNSGSRSASGSWRAQRLRCSPSARGAPASSRLWRTSTWPPGPTMCATSRAR